MITRLAAAIAITAGALMAAAVACESDPAATAPTPAQATEATPAPTATAPATAAPLPTTAPDTPAPPGPTPGSEAPDPDRQAVLERAQAELEKHRGIWDEGLRDDYSFVYTPICFCPQELVRPVRITVAGGVIASIVYAEGGGPPAFPDYERYLTIDGLFDLIQDAIDREAASISVSYDPDTGYPTDGGVDYDTRIADEEFGFTVTRYAPGSAGSTASGKSASLTGTVTYLQRIALSPEAVVTVSLEDVSLQDAPSVTLGEVTLVGPGQVPIEFEIRYDPSVIEDWRTYAVQATIYERGQLMFINTSAYDVITGGNPTHVDMVLDMVTADVPTPPAGPTPSAPDTVAAPAPIESVALEIGDDLRYSLRVVSGLPSGCATFEKYVVERDGTVVRVSVTNRVAVGPVACTAIYLTHEGVVDLGGGFVPGETYSVVVNGETTNSFVARDSGTAGWTVVESPIETVEIIVLESYPAQYQVMVVSRLPRGSTCSRFTGYDVDRRYHDEIRVTVTHLEVVGDNVPCTLDLPVVETIVPLGSDFTSGEEYTVVVNGVTAVFKAQ